MVEKSDGGRGDSNREMDSSDIADGKFFAAVGYLTFLCWVPLFLKKDSQFAQFHGRQALILFILELAAGIIAPVPFLGGFIAWIAFVVFGLISLFCIFKVLSEESWKIPYIYDISEKIKF